MVGAVTSDVMLIQPKLGGFCTIVVSCYIQQIDPKLAVLNTVLQHACY